MLRRIMAGCVCAAVIALIAAGALFVKGAHAGAVAAEPTPSEAAPANPSAAQVRTVALTEAANGGDGAPTTIEEASGTLGQATAVLNGEHAAASGAASQAAAPSNGHGGMSEAVIDPETGKPWVDSPVDVVAMRGNFTLNSAPVPAGDPEPKGTVLTLIIDKQTGTVEGRVLNETPPGLSSINPTVTNLDE